MRLFVGDAVELVAGADEDLAVADRRGCAEVAVVGGELVHRERLELSARSQDVRVAVAADEVDFAVGDDRRAVILLSEAAATAEPASEAAAFGRPIGLRR